MYVGWLALFVFTFICYCKYTTMMLLLNECSNIYSFLKNCEKHNSFRFMAMTVPCHIFFENNNVILV